MHSSKVYSRGHFHKADNIMNQLPGQEIEQAPRSPEAPFSSFPVTTLPKGDHCRTFVIMFCLKN